MKDEGVIKFQYDWIREELLEKSIIYKINNWRAKLYDNKLIGAYPDGTGYGNISVRMEDNIFMITGSTTGSIEQLTSKHYAMVTEYDILNNSLTCKGEIKASSESLTHAAIYKSMPLVNAVVHIHNNTLWKKLINKVPTTSSQVEYGTPEMAFEINRLLKSTSLKDDRILVMANHKDGLITFGHNLDEAAIKALKLCSE
jgi:ribulose-5-phosphate 4-epimerase/fuculose-1-phosphate aldolase